MPTPNFFSRLKYLFNPPNQPEDSTKSTSDESSGNTPLFDELGVTKLKAVVSEIYDALPLFERAGFVVDELQLEIGVSSKFMPRFKIMYEVDDKTQQALIAEASDKKLIKFVLISLFKACHMQHLLKDPNLKFYAIEIDLTDVPAVRGIYKRVSNPDNIVSITSKDTD